MMMMIIIIIIITLLLLLLLLLLVIVIRPSGVQFREKLSELFQVWNWSNLTQQHCTAPNMSQHVATRWPNARNLLRPTMLQYVRSFGRGLTN